MEKPDILYASDIEILKQCLKIRNDVFTIEKKIPGSIEVDEYDCLDKRCDHFLIRLQGENVGTIRCLHASEGVVRVQRFCIYCHRRKGGLGKATMDYIEHYYCDRGMHLIVMDAKFEAAGFYEKCGYKKVSDIFIEAGIEHVKMEKNISR